MYIVTGGAGFIGSAMLRTLNGMGIDDILVVDALGTGAKWKNLTNARYTDFMHKDEFLDAIRNDEIVDTVEAVIHMGACSATTETDADYLMRNNYEYSVHVAQWALERGARLIHASSAATYGAGERGYDDSDEITPSLKPLNMYGYSKQLFDLWALRTGAADRLASLKFFNVFGPNEYHKGEMASLIFKAVGQIQATGALTLFRSHRDDYGDGEQKRDFVYVKDCCSVMQWLLEHPDVNGIFNAGTGTARTWNDLGRAVFSAMDREPEIKYIDMPESIRGQYQYFTEAKMDKLRAAGCDAPFTPLEDAVDDYVRNYLLADDRYC